MRSVRFGGDEHIFHAWLFDLIGAALVVAECGAVLVSEFQHAVRALVGLLDHAFIAGGGEAAFE